MSDCKYKVGDVWLTRDGRKQQVVAVVPVNPVTGAEGIRPVHTVGEAGTVLYPISGLVLHSWDEQSSLDLIEPYVEPRVPREWWINLYDLHFSYRVHTSLDDAIKSRISGFIECVHVREVLED